MSKTRITNTQSSLKALVLISIWCHELCSFQWQRKSKGFREKRPEDCLIFQFLKRDFHPKRSHPGVPDRAQRSFLRSNLYPDLPFWSQETSPPVYPARLGLQHRGCLPPLSEAPASSVNYQKFPISPGNSPKIPSCPRGVQGPGEQLGCSSWDPRLLDDLRLTSPPPAPGSLLRTDTGLTARLQPPALAPSSEAPR